MDVSTMKEILKMEFGIHNQEEFEDAVRKSVGINLGIFTMPIERSRCDSEKENSEKITA